MIEEHHLGSVFLKTSTTDVGETYRYRGEVRRRPKIVTTHWTRCETCGVDEFHRWFAEARHWAKEHRCDR